MFANHQPQIAAFGRRGPEQFRRVACFVICTIRMPLRDAAKDCDAAYRSEPCRSIFGAKHAGLAELRDHAAAYYEQCERSWHDSENAADEIVGTLTHVPALGFVKAGFLAQMLYGVSGCIDTHNCARYGIDPETWHYRDDARYRKARMMGAATDYNRLCARLGGTEQLWDSWCEYVAARGTAGTYDADAVSALHLAPLGV
jgi:hypothetical protein